MVYRCYVEKRQGFDVEAKSLCSDLINNLGISSLKSIRIFNRYDAEGFDAETYSLARTTVFSEPQCDDCYDNELPQFDSDCHIFAVESLPGQFDQRADSCAQCIQMITRQTRPLVSSAKVYVFSGVTEADVEKIKDYLINPVECREASMFLPETLAANYPAPPPVKILEGFITLPSDALPAFSDEYGLAMDIDDLAFLQSYFRDTEHRDPTLTELKLVDTYWSDHCRHTTFGTHIDSVEINDEQISSAYDLYLDARREVYGSAADNRPQTLMDIATLGTKVLKKRGLASKIDVSEEINACSIHVDANIDGKQEDWLLMFKNETHNHPTEIEPFGGAATCIGGAIRDPLAGRSYVYQAMRVTGAGDPRTPISETLPGKLPQKKLTATAAKGYSSYGNQIGLATGIVHEFYHPGYVAKRMEVGAVIAAVPAANVIRQVPEPGDCVILLGGRTGRDGCGGATGSSKSHTNASITSSAAEVQKGNAPEERKLQRLFRNPEVARRIRRCNDFGAGGLSVAVGELADGVSLNLDVVPKKYEGLDGTELATSESQERMAIVVSPEDVPFMISEANKENLEATVVAEITEEKRLVMRWRGTVIADISREFLNSNGVEKHTSVSVSKQPKIADNSQNSLRILAADLNNCSQRGLIENFDSSIGAASVLSPFGGKTMKSPVQVMSALLPVGAEKTSTCSLMSFGFDPYLSEQSPFRAACSAVVESAAKIVAAGGKLEDIYLSLQEYFEKLRNEPARWGKPFSALLGAFVAQLGLGIPAIGGKDSMSGSFNDMDVPPTLISFAVAATDAENIISTDFKTAGNPVYCFGADDVFSFDELKTSWADFGTLCAQGKVLSAWAVGSAGAADGILKMSFGNSVGFKAEASLAPGFFFTAKHGTIIAECSCHTDKGILIGYTTDSGNISISNETADISELLDIWENPLEDVFPTKAPASGEAKAISSDIPCKLAPIVKIPRPHAVIPVFPGTNCEFDTARAVERAGGEAEILVIRNLEPYMLDDSIAALRRAISESQMIIFPGGFSGGDEPDGSGKFISALFRNAQITDTVHELLYNRDGLILGICNGFQALVKLGLVPYGKIIPMTENCPTLTFNNIGRHQSRYVHTRIASNKSPWLSKCSVGDVHTVPISHGEGRFVAPPDVLKQLIDNGQVATQYCDSLGNVSMDISVNPNGSMCAIEGILSPDGRVLGKMAHTERSGNNVAKNIYGSKFQPIFEGGIEYFK